MRKPGYVYFIRSINNHDSGTKIGFSADPKKRLKSLKCIYATPLEIVAIIPGTDAHEKRLHALLRRYRTYGEWFHYHRDKTVSKLIDKFILNGFPEDFVCNFSRYAREACAPSMRSKVFPT